MAYFLLFLLLLGPVDAAASGSHWSRNVVSPSSQQRAVAVDSTVSVLSTRYAYDWVRDRQSWHRREATLELPLSRGALVTTLAQQRRFGQGEVSGQVDYWMDVRENAYAHGYVSLAPNAQTMSRFSLGGELYEVVGGWEFSGWYEWRQYYNADVHVMGPQIAWYVGDWYLRARTTVIEQAGNWSLTQALAARRYLGSPDTYVDGQVGYGRTVEMLHPDLPLHRSRAYFAAVRLRKFVTSTLGFTVGGNYSSNVIRRAGISVGLLARW